MTVFVDEMPTKQKSIMLARLNGNWEVREYSDYVRVCKRRLILPELFLITDRHNFYTSDREGHPHLMPFAWDMLNWAFENIPGKDGHRQILWDALEFPFVFGRPAAKAQKMYMDAILRAALDFGMISP